MLWFTGVINAGASGQASGRLGHVAFRQVTCLVKSFTLPPRYKYLSTRLKSTRAGCYCLRDKARSSGVKRVFAPLIYTRLNVPPFNPPEMSNARTRQDLIKT